MRFKIFLLTLLVCFASCNNSKKKDTLAINTKAETTFNFQKLIDDCENQLEIAVPKLTDLTKHPRLIDTDKKEWKEV